MIYGVKLLLMLLLRNKPMDLMTVYEVAQMLHVHPLTVRRKLYDGKIRAYRVDNLWRIPKAEVFRYLEESTQKANLNKST